ncbi:cobyrinate a,c-diamide synthase [Actinocorallia sp. API 0066]|uniref:cobyrinate a,c-diamide synthase n=1 Tax=Actinocorallia sp. API 0066 TaxID=2896846 RepID=UPI001E4D68E7|nr:cobyrinate a,c-diamide synthase [Actinocorallia sp. API 0066]MCD0452780.1 cobyrinate a,c-diamide synthase [Actinocorallia sp. API 0066]
MIPRLVVAAASSGAGKTTIATGLMAALAGRGLAVSPHKVGPDYIDPGYHALATGLPGRNLDPFLVGEERVAPLFRHGARGADVAVVEGVMGLFDGAVGQGDFASTAHVARLLRAPVVLIVDCASAGRSIAAAVHGFLTFDPGGHGPVWIGGVVLNRVGSDRHEEICRAAMAELGVPVLGVVRRHEEVATPSRHLGLIPVAERRPDALRAVRRLGAIVEGSCDLDALLALARTAPALDGPAWAPEDEVARSAGNPVVAVAGGPAFTFGYAEQSELLEAAGATVVPFDPLRDEALPPGARALVIGGGFPEMYAADLGGNKPLMAEIAGFAGPVYAECAGMLYLARELDGTPMCGVLDATAAMTPKLTLGYRRAVAVADSAVARVGERVHGHEFHRTAMTPPRGTTPAWQWSPDGPEGFVHGGVLASYLHLHWAGAPRLPERLVAACA